ncbi:MAG: hypothetical protein Q7S96_02000 [bacterium]|nr:hypothetical protein [bacterium]
MCRFVLVLAMMASGCAATQHPVTRTEYELVLEAIYHPSYGEYRGSSSKLAKVLAALRAKTPDALRKAGMADAADILKGCPAGDERVDVGAMAYPGGIKLKVDVSCLTEGAEAGLYFLSRDETYTFFELPGMERDPEDSFSVAELQARYVDVETYRVDGLRIHAPRDLEMEYVSILQMVRLSREGKLHMSVERTESGGFHLEVKLSMDRVLIRGGEASRIAPSLVRIIDDYGNRNGIVTPWECYRFSDHFMDMLAVTTAGITNPDVLQHLRDKGVAVDEAKEWIASVAELEEYPEGSIDPAP